MALVRCSECGKDVSDRATACPHCGNPLNGGTGRRETPDRKEGVKQDPISTGTPASKPVPGGCATLLIVSLVAIGLFWYAFGYESRHGIGRGIPPQTKPEPENSTLSAAVRFTGTQFVITNNDAFNWSNCKLEINSGIVRGGYELRAPLVAARSTSTIGASQFAKSDGERFNPFSMKPNSFSIACDTPRGRGYSFGEWK
jgi:hypothetical protein